MCAVLHSVCCVTQCTLRTMLDFTSDGTFFDVTTKIYHLYSLKFTLKVFKHVVGTRSVNKVVS